MRVYLLGWESQGGNPRPITECDAAEIVAAMAPEPNRAEDLTSFDVEAWNSQAKIVLSLKSQGLIP